MFNEVQREEIKQKSAEDHRRDLSLRINDMVDALHRLQDVVPKMESPAYAGMGTERNASDRLECIATTATVLVEAIKIRGGECNE